MSHSYASCHVHFVFSTKGRRNLLSADLRKRLWLYLAGIARNHGFKVLASGGVDNHVHMLVSLGKTVSISDVARLLKTISSKWIHETFPTHHDFAWQEGYGAFGVGVSGIDRTIAYISNQEAHHRTISFEDEYVSFLTRHGIDYDPRYVFG